MAQLSAEEAQVQVRMVPAHEINSTQAASDAGIPVMVELIPANGSRGQRRPTDICCVVDVSGSMGAEALLKTEDGGMSGHGLSVLDLVKHALKTIISNLTDGDRLSVVAYSTDAKKIFELIEMTPNGRRTAEEQLNELVAAGMTNLWDGLKTAFELMQAGQRPGSLQHIMLFTDGLPNINPPRGIVPMLKRLKDKEGGRLPCTVSTFGFGYELDGELLSTLAVEGSGSYNFIPDSGFVGTVFVNALANLLVTVAKDTQVTLEATNGASFVGEPFGGHHVIKKDANSVTLGVGMMQYGQTKNLVLQMKFPAGATPGGQYLKTTVDFWRRDHQKGRAEVINLEKAWDSSNLAVEPNRLRLRFVDTLRQVLAKSKLTSMEKSQNKPIPLGDCMQLIRDLIQEIQAGPVKDDEYVQGLLEDINGQVTEALSKQEWFTKWGVLYIPSLMFAHLMQQCNNFKDAGVQQFGGELFEEVREVADEIFVKMPPPVPAERPARPVAAAEPAPAVRPVIATPVISMAAYHDRFAGCFDGECAVQLADGRARKVREVQRGDEVVGNSGASKVLCVVRTVVDDELPLVALGNLKVTAYHPVLSDGEWRFPVDLASPALQRCAAVYTFVLEEGASNVVVEGVPCVSLGHGLQDGAARHPFFGSWHAVVKDLEKLPGFAQGLVDLKAASVVRDVETGLICSLSGGM